VSWGTPTRQAIGVVACDVLMFCVADGPVIFRLIRLALLSVHVLAYGQTPTTLT
jgi:hypothetical protein